MIDDFVVDLETLRRHALNPFPPLLHPNACTICMPFREFSPNLVPTPAGKGPMPNEGQLPLPLFMFVGEDIASTVGRSDLAVTFLHGGVELDVPAAGD